MEHSTAIMEDAGNAIEGATTSKTDSNSRNESSNANAENGKQNNYDRRKRKADFGGSGMHHGGRGGRNARGGGPGDNKRHKKGDMGRGEYLYVISPQRDDILFITILTDT